MCMCVHVHVGFKDQTSLRSLMNSSRHFGVFGIGVWESAPSMGELPQAADLLLEFQITSVTL